MSEETKDPQERLAAAFESIAESIKSAIWTIEQHTETVQYGAQYVGSALSEIARAIRGEPPLDV